MVRSTEAMFQEAKIAELKRLITSRTFDSLEMLEDAVDACLWGVEDQTDASSAADRAPLPR
jgi:hypothetical protein